MSHTDKMRQLIDLLESCSEEQLDEISDEVVNRTADARHDAVKSSDRSNRDEMMATYDKFSKNQRLGARRDVRQQKAGKKPDPRTAEYHSAEPGRRNFGDSVECHDEMVNELSSDTLKSYGKKAAGEIRGKTMQHGRALDSYGKANSEKKAAALRPTVDSAARKLKNRETGVQRAFDRLSEAHAQSIAELKQVLNENKKP